METIYILDAIEEMWKATSKKQPFTLQYLTVGEIKLKTSHFSFLRKWEKIGELNNKFPRKMYLPYISVDEYFDKNKQKLILPEDASGKCQTCFIVLIRGVAFAPDYKILRTIYK